MPQSQKNNDLLILLFAWIGVLLLIQALRFLHGISFVAQNNTVFVSIILVYTPTFLYFFQKKKMSFLATDKQTLQKTITSFLIYSALVFPVFLIGNHFYQMIFGKNYHTAMTTDWGNVIITHLIIAFGEEFFFRGYMQEVLQKHFPSSKKIAGISISMAVTLTSVVFAFSHSLITLSWWHPFIFFPSLLFGLLKEKTQAIWAPTLFHAACNLVAHWIFIHY